MNRLILFRHGKAETRGGGRQDIQRNLVARGCADAARVGEHLARSGVRPDVVLVSSAVRAMQTWECVRDLFPSASLEIRNGLYNATSEEAEAEVAIFGGAGTVLVVGHNPALQELAVSILEQGGAPAADVEAIAAGFPTSAAAVLRVDASGRAALEHLFHARKARHEDEV